MPSIAGPTPRNRPRGTRSTPICCGNCPSPGPIRSGRWTSPTYRWPEGSSTSPPCWTGLPAGSWPGGCRLHWRQIFSSQLPRRRSRVTASQFTSTDLIKVLAAHEIKISMDGKGAWRENVFVERLWRTIKYEEVFLRAYASVSEARAGIGPFAMVAARIHRLTGKPPTSTIQCPQPWRRNQGGKPLGKRSEPVQISQTTSAEKYRKHFLFGYYFSSPPDRYGRRLRREYLGHKEAGCRALNIIWPEICGG